MLDMVWSMMSFIDLLISFWGYAIETTAYLLNIILTKLVVPTLYEIWKWNKLNLKGDKIWGNPAHIKRHNPNKLETRAKWCIFMRYPKEINGYHFCHLVD